MAPQDSKIAVEIYQSVNNRTQNLRKILRMVITQSINQSINIRLLMACQNAGHDIVINTLLGRVTRHPAGMHCPARDDAFASSFFLFITLRVRSAVRSRGA